MTTDIVGSPLFYEDPLYCLPPSSDFVQPLLLCVVLLPWLNLWSRYISVLLLDNIMNLNLLSLGTVVSAASCCVLYSTRYQIYWRFNTYNMVFTTTVIRNHTHTHIHTYTHTQIYIYIYIYIYTDTHKCTRIHTYHKHTHRHTQTISIGHS